MLIAEKTLALTTGDLTRFPVDAIVNAANSALAGGGGLDGAIHRAGGPEIMAELRARYPNGCPAGSAVATAAGDLPARWVIHAVGPIWQGGLRGEARLLESAYRAVFRMADELGARIVALPAISAGIYAYPLDEAAEIAVRTAVEELPQSPRVESATFVLRSDEALGAFRGALGRVAARR